MTKHDSPLSLPSVNLFTDESLRTFQNHFSVKHPYEAWSKRKAQSSHRAAFDLIESIIAKHASYPEVQAKIQKANAQVLDMASFYSLQTELKALEFLSRVSKIFAVIPEGKAKTPDFEADGVFYEIQTRLKWNPWTSFLQYCLNHDPELELPGKVVIVYVPPFKAGPNTSFMKDNILSIIKKCREGITKYRSSQNKETEILFQDDNQRITVKVCNVVTSEAITGSGFSTFENHIFECLEAKKNANDLETLHPNILWSEMLNATDFHIIDRTTQMSYTTKLAYPHWIDAHLITSCAFDSKYEKNRSSEGYLFLNRSAVQNSNLLAACNVIKRNIRITDIAIDRGVFTFGQIS